MKFKLIFLFIFLISICSVTASNPFPYKALPDAPGIGRNANFSFSMNQSGTDTRVAEMVYGFDGLIVGTVGADYTWVSGNHTNFSNSYHNLNTNNAFVTPWGETGKGQHPMCDAFSISFWIKHNGTSANLRDFFGADAAGGRPEIDLRNTNGDFRLAYNTLTGTQEMKWGSISSYLPENYRFYHVVLTKEYGCADASMFQLFVDGQNLSARNVTTSATLNDVSLDMNLSFGAERRDETGALAQQWPGVVFDDILIFENYSLTLGDIQTIYNGNYTVTGAVSAPTINQLNFSSDGNSLCSALPAICANTSDLTPSFKLALSKNGVCRLGLSDQGFDAMQNDCTGNGTQSIACTYPTNLTINLTKSVYFACADSADMNGNNTAPLPAANSASLGLFKTLYRKIFSPTSVPVGNVSIFIIRQNANLSINGSSQTCNIGGFKSNDTGEFSRDIYEVDNYTVVGVNYYNTSQDGDADPGISFY